MNELEIFNSEKFGKVRTININNDIWFVGKDIAKALGYSNTAKAVRMHVDNEDRTVNEMVTVNGTQAVLINESGLYSLILSSKLPKAKEFKRWVTGEVIPQIRKNGSYGTADIDARTIAEIASIVSANTVHLIMKEFLKEFRNEKTVIEKSKKRKVDIEKFSFNNGLKIEGFPAEFRNEIDEILLHMKNEEKLNLSAVSRYCYKNGFPVSQPSVTKYYQKYFK